jgi:RNA polymerase sigma-70 factor (ECF subfamily)
MARYREPLRRMLWVILRSVQDVEDAEQEITLGLYRSLASFQFRSSFRTFLYRCARNAALDMARRRAREERKLKAATEAARGEEACNAGEDPHASLERDERRHAVWAALGVLSAQDRLIVLLKDVEDWSVEEIARLHSLPTGTVKSRLHRAREKLVSELGGVP